MAKGLLGDDGPSLFMALAVVLIWNQVRSGFTSASNSVRDELNTNHAGPLQSETTEDIKRMEKEASSIRVDWSKLPKPKSYYATVARTVWQAMEGVGTDTDKLFPLFKSRSVNELRAIANLFGVKENSYLVTTFSGTIFDWFENELSDGFTGPGDLSKMRRIWASTGLWG